MLLAEGQLLLLQGLRSNLWSSPKIKKLPACTKAGLYKSVAFVQAGFCTGRYIFRVPPFGNCFSALALLLRSRARAEQEEREQTSDPRRLQKRTFCTGRLLGPEGATSRLGPEGATSGSWPSAKSKQNGAVCSAFWLLLLICVLSFATWPRRPSVARFAP